MVEGNHLCETLGCANSPTTFGLKGSYKIRSCDQHIASLIAKGMTAFSIEGYEFISNAQDGQLFTERKTAVEKGLGNLAVLDASLDAEYALALRRLESEKGSLLRNIEALFSGMQNAVSKRHSEMKQQLSFLAANFNQFVKHRANTLVPIAEQLCTEGKTNTSFIRFLIADNSGSVSMVINRHWSVAVGSIEFLYNASVLQPATIEAAKEYNEKGDRLKSSKLWKEAEASYLHAKGIYEIIGSQSPDAATNLNDLGLLYTDTKRWSEAEECHRQAQAIFDGIDPQSLEAARNHTNFGLLCEFTTRLEEAEQHYQLSKSICEAAGGQSPNLACAVKGLGNVRKLQKRYSEAEELFRQAQRIYNATSPKSINAAYCYFQLGHLSFESKRWQDSEENYQQAKRIYESISPQSSDCAICHYKLGLVYEAQSRIDESIVSFRSAAELYALKNNASMKSNAENAILRLEAKRNKK